MTRIPPTPARAPVLTPAGESRASAPATEVGATDTLQLRPQIPSISFGGITITGVDACDIEHGQFNVQLPMAVGQFTIPSRADDLQIITREHTCCTLCIKLGKRDGRVQIDSATLNFSRPICLKNPAQSLEVGGHRWVKKVQDAFIDVKLSGIQVSSAGQIWLTAYARILGTFHQNLPGHIAQLPTIDFHSSIPKPNHMTLTKLLHSLGVLTQEGTFNATLQTRPVALSLHHGASSISTGPKAIEIQTSGLCRFDDQGLFLQFPRNESHVSSGAANLAVSGQAMVRLDPQGEVALDCPAWEGTAEGKPALISVDGLALNFDGRSRLQITGKDSRINLKTLTGHTNGHSHLQVALSQTTHRNYPRLKHFEQDTDFAVFDDGSATIRNEQNGFTQFASPFTLVAGWPMRMPDPSGVYPFAIDSPDFRSLVTSTTGAPIHGGNRVTHLPDGVNSLPARLKMIDEAQEFLFLQTHIFKDDEASTQMADALIRAVGRGTEVCVIIDSLGNAIDETLASMLQERPIYQKLRAGGVKLALHNDRLELGLRQLVQLVHERPHIAQVDSLADLTKPRNLLKALHQLALAAQDDERIQIALSHIFNEIADSKPIALLADLKRLSQDNTLDPSGFLALIERIPNFHVRAHEKIQFSEKGTAIIGGLNIGNEYLQSAWRDNDMQIDGPATRDIVKAADRNWHRLTGESLTHWQSRLQIREQTDDGMQVQIIHHVPDLDHDHRIASTIVHALKTLKNGDKAYFEHGYVSLTGSLEALKIAMIEAAARGVDVRIFTNSVQSSDLHKAFQTNIFGYRDLLEGKVHIYAQKDNRTVHSKICVLGSSMVVLGSWNADPRSNDINSEIAGAVYHPVFAAKVEQHLAKMFDPSVSDKLESSDINRQPLWAELKSAVQSSADGFL